MVKQRAAEENSHLRHTLNPTGRERLLSVLPTPQSVSIVSEFWRLHAEVKGLFQHHIQQPVELLGPKSRSQSCRTHTGNFIASKSIHPHGLVARARVNRAPKQVFGLCMVPTHGLN